MIFRIVSLIVGYCFGMLETAYFYGKLMGIDIREHGSGNTGTTNALRVMGKKAGAVVFVGDIFKTVAACLICRLIFRSAPVELVNLYAGLGTILGHDFPFYMNFKGGKGVAAMAGMCLSINVPMSIILFLIFLTIVFTTQYVSLASLTVTVLLFCYWLFRCITGATALAGAQLIESCIMIGIVVCLTFERHKANVKRLLSGTENKTNLRSKK